MCWAREGVSNKCSARKAWPLLLGGREKDMAILWYGRLNRVLIIIKIKIVPKIVH